MLKRYSREELKELLTEIFYEHYAVDTSLYFQSKVRLTGTSVPRAIYDEKTKLLHDIADRINYFKEVKKRVNKEDANMYQQGINVLDTEYKRINMNRDIKSQKENFKKTNDIYSTHVFVEIPLNKKINSLYDAFSLQVLFFDDISGSEEKINQLESLSTKEEKIQFVKEHTEITHLTLQFADRARCIISVTGNFNPKFTDHTSTDCIILPSKYSDFNKITLSECEDIRNNDLKQIIQERIDMDKEDLELMAERTIRGDNYKILRHDDDLYIRYICPSTQRVYYNGLNTDYLKRSQYFKSQNYDSYILAWYSINNLFMELTDEVLEEKAIRC